MRRVFFGTYLLFFTVLLQLPVLAQVKDLNYFINKISDAYSSGAASVTLDEGTFYLDYISGGEFLELNDMDNFTINAYNTRFIFTSGQRAFSIINCENLKIKGLTLDYWPLPFTQGTISSKDGATLTVDLHDCYAGRNEGMTNTFRDRAYFIDSESKSIKADVFPTGNLSANWLNDRQFTFTLTKPKNVNDVSPGDCIVIFYDFYGGSGHTVYIQECTDLEFADITINSSLGRTFLEVRGGGNTLYNNVQVTYGNLPEGATESRLFTSVAAGIRTIGLTKGPRIINSLFEGLGDDGCNIQGDYYLIFETGDGYINIASKRGQYFEVGDTIVSVNNQGLEVGMAVLESISTTTKPPDFDAKRSGLVSGTTYETKDNTFVDYYRFGFDGVLNAQPGYYVYNINKVGEGCRIENTTYRNIRARGIIVKAPNTTIINNQIENTTGAGILILPELVFWLESGPAKNLEIANNYVKNTNFRPKIFNGTQSAGIVIVSEGEDIGGNTIFTPGIIHSNISVRNNTVEDTPGPGMVISSTRNIELSNNQFVNTNNKIGFQGGEGVGVDVGAALYITESDSVFLCENTVVFQGENGSASIKLSESVTSVGDCNGLLLSTFNWENSDKLDFMMFPNPFHQKVTVKTNTLEGANYDLVIYNLLGRKIVTLFSGFMEKGNAAFDWKPVLPASRKVYFCVFRNKDSGSQVSKRFIFQEYGE